MRAPPRGRVSASVDVPMGTLFRSSQNPVDFNTTLVCASMTGDRRTDFAMHYGNGSRHLHQRRDSRPPPGRHDPGNGPAGQ